LNHADRAASSRSMGPDPRLQTSVTGPGQSSSFWHKRLAAGVRFLP
jgi:hypothetical protein